MEKHWTWRACASRSAAGVRVPEALLAIVIAFVAANPARAQTVQKCVAPAGQITLTSSECGAGERLVARYDAVPVSEPTPATAAVPSVRQPGAVPGRGRVSASASAATAKHGVRRGTSRSRKAPDACQSARAKRDTTLQRVGLKRNFDLLRKLDDEIWSACR